MAARIGRQECAKNSRGAAGSRPLSCVGQGFFFKGDKMERTAKCSCGKLSATASGPPQKVSACHCKSCQRRTGSAFGVAVFFTAAAVACAGESRTYVRAGDSGRDLTFHFCPSCGSTVYWLADFRPGLVAIALGCFEKAADLRPSHCGITMIYGTLTKLLGRAFDVIRDLRVIVVFTLPT